MTLYIFESSAYKYISELGSSAAQSSGRSFMYIKNNKGPNMLPCGMLSITNLTLQYRYKNLTVCAKVFSVISMHKFNAAMQLMHRYCTVQID